MSLRVKHPKAASSLYNSIGVSYCDKHGYMKSKIRIRKAEDGSAYIVKTQKFITEPEITVIQDKQDKVKQQRKGKRISKNQNHRNRIESSPVDSVSS